MGREMKRVPLDFNWPLKQRWGGYLNPHYKKCAKCSECDGTGYSKEAKHLSDQWYGYVYFHPSMTGSTPLRPNSPAVVEFVNFQAQRNPDYYTPAVCVRELHRLSTMWNGMWMHHLDQDDVNALLAANDLWNFTRVPVNEEQRRVVEEKMAAGGNSWLPYDNGYRPTVKEVNDYMILGFSGSGLSYTCVKAKCERLGYPQECANCNGEGEIWTSPQAKIDAENWTKEDPPEGDGYQLWETTSEGSPISPVFATLDGLCAWAAVNATTFGSFTATKEEWRKMLDADFVCHEEGNMIFI